LDELLDSLVLFSFSNSNYFDCSISLHLYLSIASGMKKKDVQDVLKYMWGGCFLLPLLAVIVGNWENGIGVNHQLPYGVPFFTTKDENWWLLGVYAIPTMILLTISSILMITTVYFVVQVLLKQKANKEQDLKEDANEIRMRRKWKRMLWYNQRSLLFVVVVCIGGLAASSILFEGYHVLYDKAIQDLKDYFECLLTTPIQSGMERSEMETFPQEVCGNVDEEEFIEWSRFYYSIWYGEVSSNLYYFFMIN